MSFMILYDTLYQSSRFTPDIFNSNETAAAMFQFMLINKATAKAFWFKSCPSHLLLISLFQIIIITSGYIVIEYSTNEKIPKIFRHFRFNINFATILT